MSGKIRLPAINDNPTMEYLDAMVKDMMEREGPIDLREELLKLPADVQKTLLHT